MNMVGNRVITKELCDINGAFTPAVWKGNPTTKIGFLDPSYSANGDRCVWGWLQFGEDINGKQVMSFEGYDIIPFTVSDNTLPEDQIAHFHKKGSATLHQIEPENIFYDSTEKGTIGSGLSARVFGIKVPVPIYFGGNPTPKTRAPRPIRSRN